MVSAMIDPIIFDEPLAAMEEQARLARMYRPFCRHVAKSIAARFSPVARRVAAGTFIAGILRSIPDASTRAVVAACAVAEFAKMEN